jgi:uncharacterized repeat protein (TIGR03803 family)
VFSFAAETKPKGGLTPIGSGSFLVIGDRGGAANFGVIAEVNVSNNTWTVLHEFLADTKPKAALQSLGVPGYFFTTDRGGIENMGVIARFDPGSGVTPVASLTTNLGLKVDAPLVSMNGQWFFGAREGGDLTQLSGKGAGSIGVFDPLTGNLTKLLNLHAANHGGKIKSMLPFGQWLYFTAEEGGDLSLNTGKGLGTISRLNVASLEIQRLCVFDGPQLGSKPKSLLAVDDRIYFITGEGGANNYGVAGVITNGTNIAILAHADATSGARSEGSLTRFGDELLFTTELGGANYFGTIASFTLPARSVPARLQYSMTGKSLQLAWPAEAADCVLETADAINSTIWTPIAGPGTNRAEVTADGAIRFFRLRR